MFILWLFFTGFLGFWQGLSVIVIRFALSSLLFFILPFFEPSVNALCFGLFGREDSELAAVIFLLMFIMIVMEVAIYNYRRLREKLMLTMADRLAGMVSGLFVGILIGGLASLHLYKSSENTADLIDKSFCSNIYKALEPWLTKISEPSFENEMIESKD